MTTRRRHARRRDAQGAGPQRFRLEELVPAHARRLLAGLQDPAIYRYIDEQAPPSLEWLEARYRRLQSRASPDGRERWLNWAIWSVPRRAYAGQVQTTLRRDGVARIAYVLLGGFRGQGLGTRVVAAMMKQVHQRYGTRTFEARIDARNLASIALVQRLGFRACEVAESGSPDILYRRTLRPAIESSRSSCSDERFRPCQGRPALLSSRCPS
jgi:ribosomal-protein-alanine N-acetyltransferase